MVMSCCPMPQRISLFCHLGRWHSTVLHSPAQKCTQRWHLLAPPFALGDPIQQQEIVLQLGPEGGLICQLVPQLLVLQLHALDAQALLCQAPGQRLHKSINMA